MHALRCSARSGYCGREQELQRRRPRRSRPGRRHQFSAPPYIKWGMHSHTARACRLPYPTLSMEERAVTTTHGKSNMPTSHSTQTEVVFPGMRFLQTDSASSATATSSAAPPPQQLRLKLRVRKRRVRWGEDVVDNEDLCRRSSKCCCIFHRPRAFDESSADERSGDEGNPCDGIPGRRKRPRSPRRSPSPVRP